MTRFSIDRRKRGVLIAVAMALATAMIGQAQAPPPGSTATGSVRGRVVAIDSGAPLQNAPVHIISGPGARPVLTDRDGVFTIPAIAPGRHRLSASKSGYLTAGPGSRGFRDAGKLVEVTAGFVTDNIEIRLQRAAAISGRVLDDAGDPVPGVPLTVGIAARGPNQNGQPAITTLAAGTTNDLGEYRLTGLPAGSFVIQSRRPGFASMSVTIESGEERSAVDFTLPRTPKRPTELVAQGVKVVLDSELSSPAPVTRTRRGVIRGRVTSADGRPVPALVQLHALDASPDYFAAVEPDAGGRYEYRNVPAGTYAVTASAQGYVVTSYGQRNYFQGGTRIELREGDVRDGIDIVLRHLSAISGRVVDEWGDPVEGAYVTAMRIGYEDGRRLLIASGGTRTDDRGYYRRSGLQPGDYVVSALVGQLITGASVADLPGYALTYAPGTANPSQARTFVLSLSDDVLDADISLSRSATASISGTLSDSTGHPSGGGIVLAESRRSSPVSGLPKGAVIDRTGRFEFVNVPPGEYVIQAFSSNSNPFTEGEFGSVIVNVDGSDVGGLAIQRSAGSAVSGHLTFESGSPARTTEFQLAPVRLDPDRSALVASRQAIARIGADGVFTLAGLSGPRLFRLVAHPPGWALKAVLLNGRDVTDAPIEFGQSSQSIDDLEIIVTNRVTEIEGLAIDPRARDGDIPSYVVAVFAEDRRLWTPASRFLATAFSGVDRRFHVWGLPPGSYLVAALDWMRPGEWQDPDVLESLRSVATRVSLQEGEKVSIAPRLIAR